jgi:hypothetical protein
MIILSIFWFAVGAWYVRGCERMKGERKHV